MANTVSIGSDLDAIQFNPKDFFLQVGAGTALKELHRLGTRLEVIQFPGNGIDRVIVANFKMPEEYLCSKLEMNFNFVTSDAETGKNAVFELNLWDGGPNTVIPPTSVSWDVTLSQTVPVPNTADTLLMMLFDLSSHTFTAGHTVFIQLVRKPGDVDDTYTKPLYLAAATVDAQ